MSEVMNVGVMNVGQSLNIRENTNKFHFLDIQSNLLTVLKFKWYSLQVDVTHGSVARRDIKTICGRVRGC